MKRSLVRYALALGFVWSTFAAAPAFAQILGGAVNGTIRDEQGGVLPPKAIAVASRGARQRAPGQSGTENGEP